MYFNIFKFHISILKIATFLQLTSTEFNKVLTSVCIVYR